MSRTYSMRQRLMPHRLLLMGYVLVTVIGALLLSLPISSADGTFQSYLDALFLATSGISTTGLTVVDVGSYYSLFGQITLLTIFQIGGIGYMTFILLMMQLLGIRPSLKTGIVAKESLPGSSLHLFKSFFITVSAYTAVLESIGAVILALFWMREYSIARSIYLGIFHSISAFCTAGFGLFPDSLMKYQHSALINLTVIIISLAGGIGFFVLRDLSVSAVRTIRQQHPFRLTLHTKLALTATSVVVCFGTTVIFLCEKWPATMNNHEKMLASVFQAVSASTTDGFNTIDIGKMSPACLTATMLLMFVGASPGSTGGGIKTTTLAVLFIFLLSKLQQRRSNAFGREISNRCVSDAVVVLLCFILVAFLDMMILSITEKSPYVQTAFEIFSALGNTGLSTGITSSLSKIGRASLIITMFIGRVGPLSVAYAVLSKPRRISLSYPEEDILVG